MGKLAGFIKDCCVDMEQDVQIKYPLTTPSPQPLPPTPQPSFPFPFPSNTLPLPLPLTPLLPPLLLTHLTPQLLSSPPSTQNFPPPLPPPLLHHLTPKLPSSPPSPLLRSFSVPGNITIMSYEQFQSTWFFIVLIKSIALRSLPHPRVPGGMNPLNLPGMRICFTKISSVFSS